MFLTIAIPTLNGARFLPETITSALSQIETSEDIEVLIVDNASTDTTAEVASAFQGASGKVRVVRNIQTIEVNENIRRAVELAHGEYVWILADDDVIVSGGISRVTRALKDLSPSIMLVGFDNVDQDLKVLTTLSAGDNDLDLLDKVVAASNVNGSEIDQAIRIFENAEEALGNVGFDVFGLISTIVTHRVSFLTASEKLGSGIPRGFDFLAVVPIVMSMGLTAYLTQATVLFRHYEKRWLTDDNYSQAMEIYFVVIPTVLRKLKGKFGFKKSAIDKIHSLHLANFALQLAVARNKGWKVSFKYVAEVTRANAFHWLLMLQLPLLFSPTGTLNQIGKVYRGPLAQKLRDFLRS